MGQRQDKDATLVSEAGRTLLEMLAVLVMIAIISVGVISLYRRVMVAHKVDMLYEDIRMRAAMEMEKRHRANTPETATASSGIPITFIPSTPTEGYFLIRADGVKDDVCQGLLQKNWPADTVEKSKARIYVNSLPYPTGIQRCPDGLSSFAVAYRSGFALNNNLAKTCTGNEQCDACERCTNGECEAWCPEGRCCHEQDGAKACVPGAEMNNVCCPTDITLLSEDECASCGGTFDRYCCPSNIAGLPRGSCEHCGGSMLNGTCVARCTAGRFLRYTDKNLDTIWTSGNGCETCTATLQVYTTKEECQKCPDTFVSYTDATLATSYTCHGCNVAASFYATENECIACENRCYNQDTHVCVLKDDASDGSICNDKLCATGYVPAYTNNTYGTFSSCIKIGNTVENYIKRADCALWGDGALSVDNTDPEYQKVCRSCQLSRDPADNYYITSLDQCKRCSNRYYNGGRCKKCAEGSVQDADGTGCAYNVGECDNGNVYLSYEASPCGTSTPSTMDCKKNSDCGTGKFCKVVAGTSGTCRPIASATCATLDAGTARTFTNGSVSRTFLFASGSMPWWAAENWCKAHNKRLISYNTVRALFGCNKASGICDWSKFDASYWDNNSSIYNYFWTSENYNSCAAYAVHRRNQTFGYTWNRYQNLYVMCEDYDDVVSELNNCGDGIWSEATQGCICSGYKEGVSCRGNSRCSNGQCVCQNNNIYLPYLSDPCSVTKPGQGMECTSNTSCGSGYCQIKGTSSVNFTESSCQPLISTNERTRTYQNKTYLQCYTNLPCYMSFWSAQNWCAAHGKQLVDLSDLGLGSQPIDSCNSTRDANLDWEGLTTAFGTGYIWVKKSIEGTTSFGGVTYDGVVPMIIRVGTNNNPCVYRSGANSQVLVICK